MADVFGAIKWSFARRAYSWPSKGLRVIVLSDYSGHPGDASGPSADRGVVPGLLQETRGQRSWQHESPLVLDL